MADAGARLGRLRYASGPTEVIYFLLPPSGPRPTSLVAGALFTASLALFDTLLVVAALWMLCRGDRDGVAGRAGHGGAGVCGKPRPRRGPLRNRGTPGSDRRLAGPHRDLRRPGVGASRVPLPPPASSWGPHWCHSSSACLGFPTSWRQRPMPDPTATRSSDHAAGYPGSIRKAGFPTGPRPAGRQVPAAGAPLAWIAVRRRSAHRLPVWHRYGTDTS
jgi:hypothetical protein